MDTKQIQLDEQQIALAALQSACIGHFNKIAKRAKVSPTTVSRVLNGDWENEKVIREAKKMRDEINKKKERYAKLIS